VLGIETNFIESGFPWEDAGFQATDDLDGLLPDGPQIDSRSGDDITFHYKWSDGDTVTTTAYFYNRRSCSDILNAAKHAPQLDVAPKTGEYFITTYDASRSVYERVVVWCDMEDAERNDAYTFFFYDGRDIAEDLDTVEACTFFGLQVWDKTAFFNVANESTAGSDRVDAYGRFVQKFGTTLLSQNPAHSTHSQTLCVTQDTLDDDNRVHQTLIEIDGSSNVENRTDGHDRAEGTQVDARNHANQLSKRGAEAGRYIINYHARDFGTGQLLGQYNTECETMSRTVIVKDNIFDFDEASGWNHNYKWQAEVGNNVNGWAMGSIAFAVTGVALLAFRQKRTVVVDV